MKKWFAVFIFVLVIGALAACGNDSSDDANSESKEIKIGATSGPYSDMVSKAIKPGLEELGYEVEVVEFVIFLLKQRIL